MTLRPDEALKRTYPSMWADTYYVDPFKVSADASTPSTSLTTNSQVNHTQVDTVPTASGSEQDPPVAGAQVSPHPKVRSGATDASTLATQSTKNPVTIPYVIFNLSSDMHIYSPKGTTVHVQMAMNQMWMPQKLLKLLKRHKKLCNIGIISQVDHSYQCHPSLT